MIKKNVYILFPVGYHGNYIKWSIEASDLDARKVTQKNPINYDNTVQFGGVGTSHLHTRIPTHQSFGRHQIWQILNRPDHPKIYIINSMACGRGDSEILSRIMTDILFQDREGIIISLHDNDDRDIQSYGIINSITKWPTYIDSVFESTALHISELKPLAREFLSRGFRAINSAKDREFRNFLIEHEKIASSQGILNIDVLNYHINSSEKWYQARNRAQPHEVNELTYIPRITNLSERILQINCKDIPHEKYIDIFQHIMEKFQISDNWDMNPLKSLHDEYISAQKNLQWFESLEAWQRSGKIDDYLRSHSVIESEIIKRILTAMGISFYTEEERQRWIMFYHDVSDPSWPKAPDSEMGIYNLPQNIQREILDVFQYKLKNQNPLRFGSQLLEWKNMSLDEINDYFLNYYE